MNETDQFRRDRKAKDYQIFPKKEILLSISWTYVAGCQTHFNVDHSFIFEY